jgi:hypothetical protein
MDATVPPVPEAFLIIAVVLALCGLILALGGKRGVGQYLSMIGSAIGGTVGYIIGEAVSPGSIYLPIALGIIGVILGSLLLSYAPNAALAFFTGFLGAVVAYLALGGTASGDPRGQQPPVMASLLVMVLVFALVYYFIEELMVIVTSLIGAVLVGAGVYLATQSAVIGGAALGIVFLLGVIVQYARRDSRRSRPEQAYTG